MLSSTCCAGNQANPTLKGSAALIAAVSEVSEFFRESRLHLHAVPRWCLCQGSSSGGATGSQASAESPAAFSDIPTLAAQAPCEPRVSPMGLRGFEMLATTECAKKAGAVLASTARDRRYETSINFHEPSWSSWQWFVFSSSSTAEAAWMQWRSKVDVVVGCGRHFQGARAVCVLGARATLETLNPKP